MALFDTLVQKYRSQRNRDVLSTLSDRQLDDIGLSRSDVVNTRASYAEGKPVGMRGIV